MHNKISESVEDNHGNRSIRRSKSTSNLSVISKKKMSNHIKIEVDIDEANKSSPTGNKPNGNTSPNHRRRPKRSSINNNSLLSTVTSVHELMSFIIYKDDPPSWLKQTDLYKEYRNKSDDIHRENCSSESPPPYHQQSHRKQRCNLQMYARSSQSWQSLSVSTSPPPPSAKLSSSPAKSPKLRNHSNEYSQQKIKRELNLSPIQTSIMDLSTPLNISIKQEANSEENLNKSKTIKQPSSTVSTRRRQMLCKKKVPQNGVRRRQCMNSVENQEPLEKKDSSTSSSSSQNDSNTSTSSSIEHTSPSPTTTVSASSSHHSSPTEYMRGNTSINTRLSSPLRIQTSISPDVQTLSTPQRRSTRIWAPSSFYINPMWIIPSTTTTTTPSPSPSRLLVQNPSASSSTSPTSESTNKRPRRRCRS